MSERENLRKIKINKSQEKFVSASRFISRKDRFVINTNTSFLLLEG